MLLSARVILAGSGRMTPGRCQLNELLCEHPQCPPWDLHEGMAAVSLRPPVPTMPGEERSFCRSAPRHAGQAASREAVTKASKCRPHPRHAYSNMGITG